MFGGPPGPPGPPGLFGGPPALLCCRCILGPSSSSWPALILPAFLRFSTCRRRLSSSESPFLFRPPPPPSESLSDPSPPLPPLVIGGKVRAVVIIYMVHIETQQTTVIIPAGHCLLVLGVFRVLKLASCLLGCHTLLHLQKYLCPPLLSNRLLVVECLDPCVVFSESNNILVLLKGVVSFL